MKRLEGKTAVITGAGRGIGRATAERFAEEGANVVVADLNETDIQDTAEAITDNGGTAIAEKLNVTDREAIQSVLEKTAASYGQVDIVVNNAGITSDAQLLKMEEDAWDQVIDVNLKGVFNVSQAAAAKMKEQQSGVILNASSVVGSYGNFGQTNYAAAKWGVNGMTKTWSKELGKHGIRVNAVAPGFILTPMTEKMPDKALDMMRDKSVLKQLGATEDIANAYLFLASDEAKFITGEILAVDGGVVI
ncbi:3-oxoacyl-[acyl-carrier-protein] reductase [Salisediminibacterium halotolerans]|uniref:3-oxoacyl-[acyl-carrier-protein] reductase n=1 Tax=Salisediminibacterium halotolerans TaxID=517425 RepID=A0A1H9RE94_9BACI|nr:MULTISPECIES: 3-oxoacyl-[acyl-carrier-protein] reductase [Salisediminibacterium]RLJ78327.1 3-oxoacyl-[acyl-carrier-protein] reductase [Actinophytocola xinjiangensis]RPE88334.1 3-oxoacyl-[acyl-carrier-protein] reductase [Salisediminibacterium halotolerans]TWG37303.1 3-oxoacyl-[acyl-carrier-protein] reductase [Salisediminibacterium halotolerans]SER71191.1 3-oxoacyl-[acyl-carrier protein] reductase [Salisediminibacterium haloalkalitolerans]GEL09137.1 3-oxoacyl-[acyl-carrier-protein] reductase 